MKAEYNNTLTIETNNMDDHAALMELQKVVEGKCLVYGGGITHPEDSFLQDGVTLVLADDPTENGEIRLEIVPDMVAGSPVIKIHCTPCETLDDTPADIVSSPTALERREMYKAKFQKPDFELSDRIAATKEYVNAMSEKQLEEFGHDTLNGKDQMTAALDTIAQLAEYDQNAAQKAYCAFVDINLSGFWIDIQDAPKQ